MKYRTPKKVQRPVAGALSKRLGGSGVYPCGCCDTLRFHLKKCVYSIEIDSDDDYQIHNVVIGRDLVQEEARKRRKLPPQIKTATIQDGGHLRSHLPELELRIPCYDRTARPMEQFPK